MLKTGENHHDQMVVRCCRAFGTGVPEIVTIGEFPDTSWLVVTGNILLVVHSAINYQVYARLTLEVRRFRTFRVFES